MKKFISIFIIAILSQQIIFAQQRDSFFSDDFVKGQMLDKADNHDQNLNSDSSTQELNQQDLKKAERVPVTSLSLSISSSNLAKSAKVLEEFQDLIEDHDFKVKSLVISKINDDRKIQHLIEEFKSRGVIVVNAGALAPNANIDLPNRLIIEVANGSYFMDVKEGFANFFNSSGHFLVTNKAQFVPMSMQHDGPNEQFRKLQIPDQQHPMGFNF